MSLWAFPRKVATVIKSESGTVLSGFTKAGAIYAVERAAQYVAVGNEREKVEAWLNEPDQNKGPFVLFDSHRIRT